MQLVECWDDYPVLVVEDGSGEKLKGRGGLKPLQYGPYTNGCSLSKP